MALHQLRASALSHIARAGTASGVNVIAFSGGVDSSLAAALVHEVFPSNTVAVTAISPSLPLRQLEQARSVAQAIGVRFKEVKTDEHEIHEYKMNQGESCFHCKTTLYATLSCENTVARSVLGSPGVELFNGTNKDDLSDPTRIGLVAARDFNVHSPLQVLSKQEVRALATDMGLPNAEAAASPCLRSRLARGVEASVAHLAFVEMAEGVVTETLKLETQENMRVRMLPKQRLRIEVDASRLEEVHAKLDAIVSRWEVDKARVEVAAFKSGSVAAQPPPSMFQYKA